jgi:hypothetical protein
MDADGSTVGASGDLRVLTGSETGRVMGQPTEADGGRAVRLATTGSGRTLDGKSDVGAGKVRGVSSGRPSVDGGGCAFVGSQWEEGEGDLGMLGLSVIRPIRRRRGAGDSGVVTGCHVWGGSSAPGPVTPGAGTGAASGGVVRKIGKRAEGCASVEVECTEECHGEKGAGSGGPMSPSCTLLAAFPARSPCVFTNSCWRSVARLATVDFGVRGALTPEVRVPRFVDGYAGELEYPVGEIHRVPTPEVGPIARNLDIKEETLPHCGVVALLPRFTLNPEDDVGSVGGVFFNCGDDPAASLIPSRVADGVTQAEWQGAAVRVDDEEKRASTYKLGGAEDEGGALRYVDHVSPGEEGEVARDTDEDTAR